ncbi:uncharacterized protein LOC122522251 [Polistes fuscatus]|uniref:uncharacterized protein LOC122522251 n=1 Tax=Polistes fuscatus TaxID=30207 RepID=UPI001CA9E783|nr:uncharacterized protein LOC122522251 [Polistes fuscatus]
MKLSPGHHSLPRKKSSADKNLSASQIFQRGHPTRRSCLSPQYHHQHHHQHRQQESSLHFEYFVPRSVSEFNLAATVVTDIAVAPLPPTSALRPSSVITPPASGLTTNTSATNQGRLLDASNTTTRSREKMVTFEDEGVNSAGSASNRKNLSSIDNTFM